jgi:hypothetical protein
MLKSFILARSVLAFVTRGVVLAAALAIIVSRLASGADSVTHGDSRTEAR